MGNLLDADTVDELREEITAVIGPLVLEAVQDALAQIMGGVSLSAAEFDLVSMFRANGEMHRTAAIRSLERGLPKDPGN